MIINKKFKNPSRESAVGGAQPPMLPLLPLASRATHICAVHP
jgi:hypothetical protein